MRFLLCFFLLLGHLQAMSKAPKSSVLAENIGVHTVQYEDAKRKRPILVEIWYPTQMNGPEDRPEDPIWIHPKEIRDVPIAEGKFPLIVMSHGHNGDRRDRSWLVEYLVKNGFIVASVEHYGNSWRSYNPLITIRFWERARDISFAISELTRDPLLKKKIAPGKIGFVGYSLGGLTGLTLAGARQSNIKQIAMKYMKQFQEFAGIAPEALEKTDFSEGYGDFRDPRIKAMALLSPAFFAITPESLQKVKLPIALVASEDDEVLPHDEHALPIVKYLRPAKLKLFKDKVSHFVFLNRVSSVGKELLSPEIQTESIQTDRVKIHEEVGSFLTSFFKEYLYP